ncbi:MAG: sulfotransferase [Xanthomonadales bacterium]|nr:sulfotransferase [Xanthomonadales bacterium]
MSQHAFQTAISHHQKGDIRNAQRLYMEVLRQQPQHAYALRNLGLIALETGRIEDAANLYQRALQVEPKMPAWKSELAQVYSRAGDAVAAKNQLLGALKLEGQNSLYWYLLGNLYTDLGQLDDAIHAYRQALQHNPAQARVYSALAHLAATGDYQFTATEQQQLAHQLNNPKLGAEDQSHLHFAAANLAHKGKHSDVAFTHFCQANRLKKSTAKPWQQFNAQQLEQELLAIKRVFNDEFFSTQRDFGSQSETPVFIVGMPRTGTTLVERVLSGHPQVVGRGELMHIKAIARDGLRLKTGHPFPDNVLSTSSADLTTQAQQYLRRVIGNDRHALRVVDKMPTNYQMLGLIYLLFPNARVIHTRRDPMDTLWSCFTRNISARFTNSFDDLAAMYRNYRAYMDHWQGLLPLAMLDVHYEEMVADFPGQAQRLVKFLGLEWHEACLEYHQHNAHVATASKMQVRKPIYKTAVHAWKRYEDQLAELRSKLDDYYH